MPKADEQLKRLVKPLAKKMTVLADTPAKFILGGGALFRELGRLTKRSFARFRKAKWV